MKPEINIRIWHFKISPVIGIGYWKDDYDFKPEMWGYTHNIIIPFVRIQFGYLFANKKEQ